jgi:hypothetical protein
VQQEHLQIFVFQPTAETLSHFKQIYEPFEAGTQNFLMGGFEDWANFELGGINCKIF